jgi:hypothetical protein
MSGTAGNIVRATSMPCLPLTLTGGDLTVNLTGLTSELLASL